MARSSTMTVIEAVENSPVWDEIMAAVAKGGTVAELEHALPAMTARMGRPDLFATPYSATAAAERIHADATKIMAATGRNSG